ncbi:hypothetical protein [Enterococcus dispar]|uniref:hypothetical protein n=1 Tax=Enterococcus dispar TaxID=44009 RepID=UPI00189E2BD7|nr:hypothetical protein [Enterococcus dispar]
MQCNKCNNQRVIWLELISPGLTKCQPCPVCNADGQAVAEEQKEFEAIYAELSEKREAQIRRAVGD